MSITDPVHIACAHCGATNRVPAARLREDPTCGRCSQTLLAGEPVELTDANFDAALYPRVLHRTCLRGTSPG